MAISRRILLIQQDLEMRTALIWRVELFLMRTKKTDEVEVMSVETYAEAVQLVLRLAKQPEFPPLIIFHPDFLKSWELMDALQSVASQGKCIMNRVYASFNPPATIARLPEAVAKIYHDHRLKEFDAQLALIVSVGAECSSS